MLKFLLDKVLVRARSEGVPGGLGLDTTIRAAIDEAEPQIAEMFRDSPLVEAAIRRGWVWPISLACWPGA